MLYEDKSIYEAESATVHVGGIVVNYCQIPHFKLHICSAETIGPDVIATKQFRSITGTVVPQFVSAQNKACNMSTEHYGSLDRFTEIQC